MTTRLSVGIDFSTKWADASLIASDGTPVVPHQRFDNSLPGFQGLKQLLLETLATHSYTNVAIAGEATGMYWLPFFLELAADPELRAHDTQLFVLNPRWVKWYRQSLSQVDKTDRKDAFIIADRTRVHQPRVPWLPDIPMLALRCFTRYRHHLIKLLAAEKSFFCAYLFLQANAYQRLAPFSDVFGLTSRLVIEQAVTLDTLAALPVNDLADQLDALSGHKLRAPEHNAAVLQQVATDSFQLPATLALPVHQLLEATLQHIAFLESQIAQVEGWIAGYLPNFPAIQQLRSIPGIGPVFSAGIGAEIGNVQRFLQGPHTDARGRTRPRNLRDAEDAVAKIAGLWWPRSESGTFAAEDRRMAKSGNAYLRYYLIQAADQLRHREPEYSAFYRRKFREATKHHHKRALVLTARKSVGLFVGLLHRNEPYRSKEARRT
jgi:transposase